MLSQFEIANTTKSFMLANVCCKSLLILCFPNKSNIFTCCMKNGLIWNYLEMNHNACCSFEALIIQEEPAPFIQAQINQTSSLWNTHVGGWEWKWRWRDKLVHVFFEGLLVCVDLKWIWTAGFGMVQLALKCISCVLVCPVPQQRSRLTSSLKECSRFKSEALSTEFEAWSQLP